MFAGQLLTAPAECVVTSSPQMCLGDVLQERRPVVQWVCSVYVDVL